MAMNHFPPQAYTRDMLSTAYEWLRSQPSQVRELAKDSDSLVALYMQARRRTTDSTILPTPSVENFKQDLKNLAEGIKQFDEPKTYNPTRSQIIQQQVPMQTIPNTTAHAMAQHSVTQHTVTQQTVLQPAQYNQQPMSAQYNPQPMQAQYNPQPIPAQYSSAQQSHYAPVQNQQAQIQQANQPQLPAAQSQNSNPPQSYVDSTGSSYAAIDHATREKLRTVQLRLNLSSESEAMRMLIAIGYEEIQSLLPK